MARSNIAEVEVRWRSDLVFEGQAKGERPAVVVDGDSKVATSPVELLLMAAASCTMADVVIILQKQRVDLRTLDVHVRATRRETDPRRVLALHFDWRIAGEGAEETKARRAIDLSLEKYCSVMTSLAPDIAVTSDVTVAPPPPS